MFTQVHTHTYPIPPRSHTHTLYLHAHTHTHTHTHTRTPTLAHTHTPTPSTPHTHKHLPSMLTHVPPCCHTRVHTYLYLHAHTHIHLHLHTHTHAHTPPSPSTCLHTPAPPCSHKHTHQHTPLPPSCHTPRALLLCSGPGPQRPPQSSYPAPMHTHHVLQYLPLTTKPHSSSLICSFVLVPAKPPPAPRALDSPLHCQASSPRSPPVFQPGRRHPLPDTRGLPTSQPNYGGSLSPPLAGLTAQGTGLSLAVQEPPPHSIYNPSCQLQTCPG